MSFNVSAELLAYVVLASSVHLGFQFHSLEVDRVSEVANKQNDSVLTSKVNLGLI